MNCRWRLDHIVVDVMPAHKIVGYVTNTWYKDALKSPIEVKLRSGKVIRVISPVYLIATKLEAFKSRGDLTITGIHNGESNKDLEDIVHLLEGRRTLLEEIKTSDQSVRKYIEAS